MGDKTGIGWTDATWNPVRGCSRVSAGCENCYAETMAGRFKGEGMPYEGLINKHGAWNGNIKLVPEKLDEPLRWTKPRRVFVNSMSDLFHENVPFDYIDQVFAVMALSQRHTFQVLTKRPARARDYLRSLSFERLIDTCNMTPSGNASLATISGRSMKRRFVAGENRAFDSLKRPPLPNVHLGVSVEDQATADERIPLLLETPATVRFVSYEPALWPVDFTNVDTGSGWRDALNGRFRYPSNFKGGTTTESVLVSLDWIIVGGESGPGARPFDVQWARDTVAACKAAGVACFVKQLGSKPMNTAVVNGKPLTLPVAITHRKGEDMNEWPESIRVQEFPVGLAEAGDK